MEVIYLLRKQENIFKKLNIIKTSKILSLRLSYSR